MDKHWLCDEADVIRVPSVKPITWWMRLIFLFVKAERLDGDHYMKQWRNYYFIYSKPRARGDK